MSKNKIKIDLTCDEISKIQYRHKEHIDIDANDIEKKYKLVDVRVVSKDACAVFTIIHPVIVSKYHNKGEYFYKIIANHRTLEIAKSVLDEKDSIPMIVINNRSAQVLREISSIDCVGSLFVYSCDDRRTLKTLIKKMNDTFRKIFPGLDTNEKIAMSIGVNEETFFYNIKDRGKSLEQDEEPIEDTKENLQKRYLKLW